MNNYIELTNVAVSLAANGACALKGYNWLVSTSSSHAIREPEITFEKASTNWCAYSDDVPGCVATGSTRDEAQSAFKEALKLHLVGLAEDGYIFESKKPVRRRGNTLAVLKAIRQYNKQPKKQIKVYLAKSPNGEKYVIRANDFGTLEKFICNLGSASATGGLRTNKYKIVSHVEI